jgi:hypothetical protein
MESEQQAAEMNEKPETIGQYLMSRRKSSGLTIEGVSLITKITPKYIEAIENDDFSMFSSPQLLKGYVKLISKTIKADEKKTAAFLDAGTGENFKGKQVEDIVGERFKEEIQKTENFRKRVFLIIIAGISIIILLYSSIRIYRYIKTAPAIHIALPFGSTIKSAVSGVLGQKRAVNAPGQKAKGIEKTGKRQSAGQSNINFAIVLKAKIIRRTWVDVKIDGGTAKISMLYPGDTESWKAKKRLRIKIGNAGGVILNYNGKNIGKPGVEKQVVTLNFPTKLSGRK